MYHFKKRTVLCRGLTLALILPLTGKAERIKSLQQEEAHVQLSERAKDQVTEGSGLMDQAALLWQQATQLENQSGEAIKHANRLRKELSSLRAKAQKFSRNKSGKAPEEAPENELLQSALQSLGVQVSSWQTLAGKLRAEAASLKQRSLTIMQQGFVTQWSPWVTHQTSLSLLGDSALTASMHTAHNAPVRSIHPNKPAPSMESVVTNHNQPMSLQRVTLSGQNIPPGLETSTFKLSRNHSIFSHIEAIPSPVTQNQTGKVPMNKIHQWALMLSDTQGKPIQNARITVEGHMPGHVHGLPTQPEVIEEFHPGIYRVDGVKFQMSGWWVITFKIEHDRAQMVKSDSVTFNLVL